MPAITRVGDADVTHCSGMVREGHVKTVFCNGIEVSCEGHNNTGHLYPAVICLSHQAPIAKGSPNVFANGGSASKENTDESLVPDDGSNFGEGGA